MGDPRKARSGQLWGKRIEIEEAVEIALPSPKTKTRDLGAVNVFPSGRNWSSVCSVDTRARLPISPIYPLFSFHPPPPTTTVGWSMTIAGFIRISRAGWSPGKKFSGAHAVGGALKVQSSSWEKKTDFIDDITVLQILILSVRASSCIFRCKSISGTYPGESVGQYVADTFTV